MELQGFLMSVSLILIFFLNLSPFHLIWMLPVSFILGLLSALTPLRVLWIFSSIYFSLWYIGISNIGRKFYVDGEYEKAVIAIKEDINKKPTSDAYFNLALAYGKLGDDDNEIIAYQKSIDLKPKPEAYFNVGKAYACKGNNDEAIIKFKLAIGLRPEYLKANYLISIAYSEIGDKENAVKALEIVRRIDSKIAHELESIIHQGNPSLAYICSVS
jgi:tetratricopeptide (TPR) repeat protein